MVIRNVDVNKRATLLHEGRVSQRTLISADGEMTALGLMMPGLYRFTTEGPEVIEITQGQCRVRIGEQAEWTEYLSGHGFQVPAHTHFEIEATEVLDYVRRVDQNGT